MFNIPVSEEHVAIEELMQMSKAAALGLVTLSRHAELAYNLFWNGTVSPAAKIQVLGTRAAEVFTKSAQAQAFLAANIADYVPLTIPAGYEVTWHPDGSASIAETAPPE